MFKKHFYKIVLLFTTLGITSLQAAHLPPGKQEEGKHNDDNHHIAPLKPAIEYENYTQKHSKKEVNNSILLKELKDEKEYFMENNIGLKIKEKKGAVFFLMITSHKETKALNKFFFFNRDPNEEKAAIKRVNLFYRCHVISHTKPMVSPHVIVQVLGWLAENSNIYAPLFIYSNGALCTTCHALVGNLFKLNMVTNAKGCNGARDVELANICPLAQRYINSRLTVALAQKILLPKVSKAHENKLQQMAKDKDKIIGQVIAEHENKLQQIAKGKDKIIGQVISEHENQLQQMAKGKDKIIAQVIAEKDKQTKELTRSLSREIKFLKGILKDCRGLSYAPLKGHAGEVVSVAVTKDNRYIVSGDTKSAIRIWELNRGGKEVSYSPLKGHTGSVYSLTVTDDNKYIVSGSYDHTIRIWDFKTGKEVNYSPLKGHTHYVERVAISSDNRYIVSGSYDLTIRIWDFKTGKEVDYSPLKGHTSYVNSVEVTSDHKYIVTGGANGNIRIWDFKTGKEVNDSPLKAHSDSVYSLAVTKDNQYIVSGSGDKTIRIWSLKTGKEVDYSPLKGHDGCVSSVKVTSDNHYIVTGGVNGTIRIWSLKTGKEVKYSPLTDHTGCVYSLAASDDNKYIVSGSRDKAIRIWNFGLLRYLDEDEHKEAVHQEDNDTDNKVFDID